MGQTERHHDRLPPGVGVRHPDPQPVAGNNAPDIALFPQPGLLKDLAQKSSQPLDDVLDMAKLKTSIVPGSWTPPRGRQALRRAGVDEHQEPGVLRQGGLGRRGYKAPKTIDELLALTDQIKAAGKTPWCIGIESGAATGWPITDWIEDLVLRHAGPDNYDKWVNHELKFNSPEIKPAFDTSQKIAFTDGNVLGGPKSIVATNFRTGGNPLFDPPPGCYMYKQGNFVAHKGGFPDAVGRQDRHEDGSACSRSRPRPRATTVAGRR